MDQLDTEEGAYDGAGVNALADAAVNREAFTGPIDNRYSVARWRPGFLDAATAAEYFSVLSESCAWCRELIQVRGISHVEPRAIFAVGPGIQYSRKTVRGIPWHEAPEALRQLRRQVEKECCCQFNAALCNKYESGGDGVGWHADDEIVYGEQPTIASVSLGATRDFLLRPSVREKGHKSIS